MRKILLFMLALLLFNTSWAQDAPPEMFKFQALITKPDGKPVKNKMVGVKISIRQSATNGTLVYRETFTPTTNNAGIINLEIGNGTPKYGVFSEIPWEAGEFFLKLRVDINGGTNYTNMGTSQLLSVPYALYAKKAQSVEGDNDTDPNNEIQTLSLESNILSLSDGGEVTLPSLEDFSYYFADRDKDAYGDRWSAVYSPSAPVGYVDNENDCDDNDAYVFPGAAEICDGIDNNCDGNIDEGVTTTYYADSDGDGYGDFQTTIEACSEPNGYVSDSSDCDDNDASVFPGTEEICDGIDNDCDGEIDEGCVADNDNDGFTIEQGDCNDSDPTVNPEEEEVCDGKDNDCDGQIDEDIDLQSDSENCGACGEFCPPGTSCIGGTCLPIPDYDEDGYTIEQGDCDDNDPDIYPGNSEICDGKDNDCSGGANYPGGEIDGDGDGVISCYDCDDNDPNNYPGNQEVCDGKDNNCNGLIDQGDIPLTTLCPNPPNVDAVSFDCNGAEGCVIIECEDGWYDANGIYEDGCESQQSSTPQIGDFYQGGVVFYIFQAGDNGYIEGETHGLICAVSDQSTGIQLQYNLMVTGANGIAIGTGSANTDILMYQVDIFGNDLAAGIARGYNGGGYSDWFLPSKDELNEMYNKRELINSTAIAINDSEFIPLPYWSSSEYTQQFAWIHDFSNIMNPSGASKNSSARVRAVRAF